MSALVAASAIPAARSVGPLIVTQIVAQQVGASGRNAARSDEVGKVENHESSFRGQKTRGCGIMREARNV